MSVSRLAYILLGFLLLATIGYGAVASIGVIRNELQPAQIQTDRLLVSVPVKTVMLQNYTPKLQAYGFARSSRSWTVLSQSSGRVVEVASNFKQGARVQKGDVLLRVVHEDLDLQLAQAQVDRRRLAAQLENLENQVAVANRISDLLKEENNLAEQRLERTRTLQTQGAATSSTLENITLNTLQTRISTAQQDASVLTLQQQIVTTRGQLDTIELVLANYERLVATLTVTAPFDCAVSEVDVNEGEFVVAGQALGRLIDLSDLEIRLELPETELAGLQQSFGRAEGFPAQILTAQGTGSVDANIGRVSAVRSETSTARTVFAQLERSGAQSIVPGDFVEVAIPMPELQDVAIIPAPAVDDGSSVFVVGPENRLETRLVDVVSQNQGNVVVRGLQSGDMVVLQSDARFVNDLPVAPVVRQADTDGHADQ